MNCKEVLALQTEYIDGELPENEAQKIRFHLKTCDTCRGEFTTMEELLHALHNLDDIPVPENLADEVIAAVKRGLEKEKRFFVLPRFLRSWQTYSVAAACILLFTAVSTDINHHAAMTNTAYIYTTESAAPRAVEIPAAFVDNATTDEMVPSDAILAPDSALSMHPTTSENSTSISDSDLTAPTDSTPVPSTNSTDFLTVPPLSAEMHYEPAYAMPPVITEDSTPQSEAKAAPEGATVLPPRVAAPESARSVSPQDVPEEPSETRDAPSSAQGASNSASAPKTYSTVGSLVKRRVTFVVDDAGAQSVFNNAKSGGVTSVKNALYRAGIDFSTRESVIEELAPKYNALVKEANSLSSRIAAGNTSLRSKLSQKEAEMQALKDSCKNPSLALAFE